MGTDQRTAAGQECTAAETWLARGSPRAALTAAGAALAGAPDSPRARRLRARALLELGQPETALFDLVAVAESSADSAAPWYDVLAVAQQTGNRALVERAVAGVDADGSLTVDAVLDAVDAAYLDGDLDAARAHLGRALENDPEHPEVADWARRLGRRREAGALDLELAGALLRRGRPHDALVRLDEAVVAAGDQPSEREGAVAFFRGRALLHLGRFSEAVAALELARRVAPDDPEIALELATAAHLDGDQPATIMVCDQILERTPTEVSALLLAAEAHLAGDHLDRAHRLARQALDVAPVDPAAWCTWAAVLVAVGDAAAARVAADRAIALDPGLAAAWRRGADVLGILGRDAFAEWYRAAAAARGGGGRRVDRHELPALGVEQADVDDALRRSTDPETPFAARDRFRVACELHHHDLAEALGERLAPTEDGSVSTVLGFIAVERGDLETARTRFRAALDTNPSDAEASGGLALVAGLSRAAVATPAPTTPAPPPTAPAPAPRPTKAAAPTRPARAASAGPTPERRKLGVLTIARRIFVLVWMAVGFTSSGLMLYRLVRDDGGQQRQPAAVQETVAPPVVPEPTASPVVTGALPAVPPVATPPPLTAPPAVPVTAPPAVPVTMPPTVPAPPTTFDEFAPRYFTTPEDAMADWLSFVDPPYAGTCESLSGQIELAGTVTCSTYDHDAAIGVAEVFRWGVFGTDDLRGWVLVDAGSAGWSVADETFEAVPPW